MQINPRCDFVPASSRQYRTASSCGEFLAEDVDAGGLEWAASTLHAGAGAGAAAEAYAEHAAWAMTSKTKTLIMTSTSLVRSR